jgi:hypothetical protein
MSARVDVVLVPLKIVGGKVDTHNLMTEHSIVSEDDTVSIFVAEGALIAIEGEALYPSKEMIPKLILEVLQRLK